MLNVLLPLAIQTTGWAVAVTDGRPVGQRNGCGVVGVGTLSACGAAFSGHCIIGYTSCTIIGGCGITHVPVDTILTTNSCLAVLGTQVIETGSGALLEEAETVEERVSFHSLFTALTGELGDALAFVIDLLASVTAFGHRGRGDQGKGEEDEKENT